MQCRSEYGFKYSSKNIHDKQRACEHRYSLIPTPDCVAPFKGPPHDEPDLYHVYPVILSSIFIAVNLAVSA